LGQQLELESLVRNGGTPQKVAMRGRLLLLAHQGVANQSIAEQLSLSSHDPGAAQRHRQGRDGGRHWHS
jgi:hypothetical protein